MSNIKIKRRPNSALLLLISRILKEQKGLLIFIAIFTVIIVLLPLSISWIPGFDERDEMGRTELIAISGFFGWVTWIPSLFICLAILPIVHRQIFATSLLKRIKSSSITSINYVLVVVGLFALTSTILFWVISIISQPIYANAYNEYEFSFQWITFIFITPIVWIAFATTGLLIGHLKMPEVLKGILIFLIFSIITIFSSTILNPELLDMYPLDASKMNTILLSINPWALMINTVHYSVVDINNDSFNALAVLISVLLSTTLLLLSINLISLK